MVEVNMKQMKIVAQAVFGGGYPLLIRGRHGIGKSAFIYQFAKEAGIILGAPDAEFKVIERRASLMTEGDLTGLPYRGPKINGQDSTKFNPPDWFLEACEFPRVLFFDEVDRGISEVRQGIFEINDSRSLNGHKLHPLSRVVACINGGLHGSNYQVGDFDPAELDRYQVYDLEPTVEEWAEFCRDKGVMPEIINFCLEQPKFLEIMEGVHDPSVVTPSRRSWERLSHTLKNMNEFKDGFEDETKELMFMIAQGYIGEEAAAGFSNFALEYQRVVDPKKVVYDGELEAMDKMTISDYADFTSAFVKAGIMKDTELTEKHFSNIRQCIMKMPTEALIIFWQQLCFSGEFEVNNVHKLGWDFENKDSEEEQIAFTKVLADRLIDPPEDEDINALIEKVQKEHNDKSKPEAE